MADRADLMTYEQGEQLRERFDRLIGLLGEEVNIHPDTLQVGAIQWDVLRVSNNSAVTPRVEWSIEDRDSGRWLRLRLWDATGYPVMLREWHCVFRSPDGTMVVDRPGSLAR